MSKNSAFPDFAMLISSKALLSGLNFMSPHLRVEEGSNSDSEAASSSPILALVKNATRQTVQIVCESTSCILDIASLWPMTFRRGRVMTLLEGPGFGGAAAWRLVAPLRQAKPASRLEGR